MNALLRILTYPVASEKVVGMVAQYLCYVGALLVLGLGFQRLPALTLTQGEFFLGVLLVLAVSLLMIVMGMLIAVLTTLKERVKQPA